VGDGPRGDGAEPEEAASMGTAQPREPMEDWDAGLFGEAAGLAPAQRDDESAPRGRRIVPMPEWAAGPSTGTRWRAGVPNAASRWWWRSRMQR
jgi:hypothetical protein